MSKVYDCCMVHSEVEMLLLRLNILKDVVDHFVIVEAGETHSGQPKPAIIGKALATDPRFDPFCDQIIYSYTDHLEGDHSWARERYHRGLISGVLANVAAPDDWVIVGDCDEIPNPEAVRVLSNTALANSHFTRAVTFHLDFFYYDFAHKVSQGWGIGACKWDIEQDANKIRTSQFGDNNSIGFANQYTGWHLSYFMTPEQVAVKLDSFMHHADVARDVPRDPIWIGDRMRAGLDLFGRTVEISEVEPEPYLPEYVKAHREHYEALGWLRAEKVTP